MATLIQSHEAKVKWSEILNRVEAGESFTITRHGQSIATVTPTVRPKLTLEEAITGIRRRWEEKHTANPDKRTTFSRRDLHEGHKY